MAVLMILAAAACACAGSIGAQDAFSDQPDPKPISAGASRQAPLPRGPYNLVFVSFTNTRADHLGVYGYERNTSPNIDALAKKCLVFRDAYTHASWTLPALVSVFTSQYPFTHGMMNRQNEPRLRPEIPTLVDILHGQGYTSAAFVGGRDYDPNFGHTSRFQFVQDVAARSGSEDWKRYGVLETSLPAALQWLEKKPTQPFFLLVQGYDAHCPFAIPKANPRFDPNYRGAIDFTRCYWTFERTRPVQMRAPSGEYQPVYLLKTRPEGGEDYEALFYPEDVRHMIALYDGEIFDVDALVGRLWRALESQGLHRNTVVVLYSDHGDMFGKHGRFMRGGPLRGTFYDDVLHIPLLIYHPALPPGDVEGLMQGIDLAPTLLDLLGIAASENFRGRSARPLILEKKAINDVVFAGSEFTPSPENPFFRHGSVILSARSREWKLIWEKVDLSPGSQELLELYDLTKDPQELVNVAKAHGDILLAYQNRIRDWLTSIQARDILKKLQ